MNTQSPQRKKPRNTLKFPGLLLSLFYKRLTYIWPKIDQITLFTSIGQQDFSCCTKLKIGPYFHRLKTAIQDEVLNIRNRHFSGMHRAENIVIRNQITIFPQEKMFWFCFSPTEILGNGTPIFQPHWRNFRPQPRPSASARQALQIKTTLYSWQKNFSQHICYPLTANILFFYSGYSYS